MASTRATVTPADVRKARAFLYARNVKSQQIQPRIFARAAKELGRSFADVLKLIMTLQMGGQAQGPAPIAQRIAMREG